MGAKTRRIALVLAALGLAAALDGLVIEPRFLLWRDEVELGLTPLPFRIVHLSDLHIAAESGEERRLIAAVAAAKPQLIVISGDLVADTHDLPLLARHTAAAAAVLRELRALAPIAAVQGHSEYLGPVVVALGRAGLEWISNAGRWVGGGGGFLLLGLNQQVGRDLYRPTYDPPFTPLELEGQPAFGRASPGGLENGYVHYDPAPASLGAEDGPLAWTNYELEADLRIDTSDAEIGVTVLSHYPVGEDRLMQIRRPKPAFLAGGSTMSFAPHGTALTRAHFDTGVDLELHRWYHLRAKTTVEPARSRVEARVWPVGEAEPAQWQAWVEDESPERLRSGTVGLWAREGSAAFRNLRVRAADGTLLLDAALASGAFPAGFRQSARATRLALALARSPEVPPEAPVVALSHIPDVALEAAERGIDAVLAGHTHGGQVRLPGPIPLTTKSSLGAAYDRGVFDFASTSRRGWTRLYINSGVGMSKLPIRFMCPPRFAVVELGPPRESRYDVSDVRSQVLGRGDR